MIEKIKEDIKELYKNEYSGHDYEHSIRVYSNALLISKNKDVDMIVITLACLLHDVDDPKVFNTKDNLNARKIMVKYNIENKVIEKVIDIINHISFNGNGKNVPSTLEGKIVQDADRLDAIGAIGIARAFSYGGSHKRKMYDKDIKPRTDMTEEEYRSSEGTTINHFYEKLLLLEDLMNTKEAKKIAKQRTKYMKKYLQEFALECYGMR